MYYSLLQVPTKVRTVNAADEASGQYISRLSLGANSDIQALENNPTQRVPLNLRFQYHQAHVWAGPWGFGTSAHHYHDTKAQEVWKLSLQVQCDDKGCLSTRNMHVKAGYGSKAVWSRPPWAMAIPLEVRWSKLRTTLLTTKVVTHKTGSQLHGAFQLQENWSTWST